MLVGVRVGVSWYFFYSSQLFSFPGAGNGLVGSISGSFFFPSPLLQAK